MLIIKDGHIVEDDHWATLDAEGPTPDLGDIIVPLSRWTQERDALKAHKGRTGVKLGAGEMAESLAEDLADIDLIVVDFPTFKDGRGFSTIRLLRERYGFKGEIRASGHIIPDQYLFLVRCGATSVEADPRHGTDVWADALGEISVFYQPTAQKASDGALRLGRAA